MRENEVDRFREFMKDDAMSCSMGICGITPEYLYRLLGGAVIGAQNESLIDQDERAIINVSEVEGPMVRQAFLPSYPTPEITVFREFGWFIAFAVVYCPECYVERDTKKVVTMLKEAIPIHVKKRSGV